MLTHSRDSLQWKLCPYTSGLKWETRSGGWSSSTWAESRGPLDLRDPVDPTFIRLREKKSKLYPLVISNGRVSITLNTLTPLVKPTNTKILNPSFSLTRSFLCTHTRQIPHFHLWIKCLKMVNKNLTSSCSSQSACHFSSCSRRGRWALQPPAGRRGKGPSAPHQPPLQWNYLGKKYCNI